MPLTVVEGTTANLDFRLTADGAAVNLTGATVVLLLYDKDGTAITTTGDVSVIDATDGQVRYAPDAADLDPAVTPHRARFKVTIATLDSFYPSGPADRWVVVAQ